MNLNDNASLTRAFSAADVAAYVALGGARTAHVPEPLIGALFSKLLGVDLPGPGANYLKQQLTFHAQAPLDAPLTARVTLTRLRPEKHLADLETVCTLGDGTLIASGRALLYVEDVAR
jgi:3-hydroxybutyryl-CoA dehydratase